MAGKKAVSTVIWREPIRALIFSGRRCDRCDQARTVCELMNGDNERISLCLPCFCELAYALGKFAGDTLRRTMGAGLRGEGIGQFMAEPEREFLNRTWCSICGSHFCSNPTEHRP